MGWEGGLVVVALRKERCLVKYFDFYDGGAWRGRGNFSHPLSGMI